MLAMDLDLVGGGNDGDLKRMAAEARARAQEIAKSVRDLSHRLHPARLRLIGLVAALQALRLELSQLGIVITFTHDNVPSTLSPDLTLCLFRVVQESLHNAIKYSRPREVSVHLGGSPFGLTLSVVDDGVGFDVEAMWGKGLGLVSMNERLEAFGGSLDIRSSRGLAPGWRSRCHWTSCRVAKPFGPTPRPGRRRRQRIEHGATTTELNGRAFFWSTTTTPFSLVRARSLRQPA